MPSDATTTESNSDTIRRTPAKAPSDPSAMSYRELQSLAKSYGIAANQKKTVLIDALAEAGAFQAEQPVQSPAASVASPSEQATLVRRSSQRSSPEAGEGGGFEALLSGRVDDDADSDSSRRSSTSPGPSHGQYNLESYEYSEKQSQDVAQESESGRAGWLDVRGNGTQIVGDLKSDFDQIKEANTHFRNPNGRFEGKDSYIQATSESTGQVGRAHTDVSAELEKVGCAVKMSAAAKHRRFSNVGSIYAKRGCGHDSLGPAHTDAAGQGDDSAPSSAFAGRSTADGRLQWLAGKDVEEIANQPMTVPKSSFSSERAPETNAVFRATGDRFNGPKSYQNAGKGSGADGVGLAHENTEERVAQMGGVRIVKSKRSRFSDVHSIFQARATSDVKSIGLVHAPVIEETDGETSSFLTKKDTTEWMRKEMTEGLERLGEVRTDFDTNKMSNAVSYDASAKKSRFDDHNSYLKTPTHISKDIGGAPDRGLAKLVEKKGGYRMKKTRRSRFSMAGGLYKKSDFKGSHGIAHSPMVKPTTNRSAAFSPATSSMSQSRSKWTHSAKKAGHNAAMMAPISEFSKNKGFAEPSPAFKSQKSRFSGPGSYLKKSTSGTKGPSRTHESIITSNSTKYKGLMKKHRHGRFSIAGGVYDHKPVSTSIGLAHKKISTKGPGMSSAAFASQSSSRDGWLRTPRGGTKVKAPTRKTTFTRPITRPSPSFMSSTPRFGDSSSRSRFDTKSNIAKKASTSGNISKSSFGLGSSAWSSAPVGTPVVRSENA